MSVSKDVLDKYEMTIGIECHVQLATKTKLFSAVDNDARFKEPNMTVSPVDYALPGMLPVLNWRAVKLSVIAGKALKSEIAKVSRFDRKHYFYPDLPKGYQTSQMYNPLIVGGEVVSHLEDGTEFKVRIHHAHMEEDAGKLTHFGDHSLVDLNRAGTPLIEIVSEADIHSPAEARAYATELYNLMTYAGVTHGDLYHGNMRFDVNLSVALKGSKELGTRTETKNLNSFRSIERAAEYEFERQVEVLESGEKVVQETRGWNDAKQITTSQRSKEDAQDYRYMPDPDIPPIVLSDDDIAQIQKDFPKMPSEYRSEWSVLGLDNSVVSTIISHQVVAEMIGESYPSLSDDSADVIKKQMEVANVDPNLLNTLVRRIFNLFASTPDDELDFSKIESGAVNMPKLFELVSLAESDKISSNGAKEIFLELFGENSTKTPTEIAEEKNLLQVSDESVIVAIVEEVLADPASQKSIEDIKAGKDKAIGFLVGQVMKKSQGKANPAMAQKMIKERL